MHGAAFRWPETAVESDKGKKKKRRKRSRLFGHGARPADGLRRRQVGPPPSSCRTHWWIGAHHSAESVRSALAEQGSRAEEASRPSDAERCS